MWEKFYEDITRNNKYAKIQLPATREEIALVEKTLDVSLPVELVSLLLEFNGDKDFLLSTKEIIATNYHLRAYSESMPLEHFLFFAHNGCGDYYGYPIHKNGEVYDRSIFKWCHETDDRRECANSIIELIQRYYGDEI